MSGLFEKAVELWAERHWYVKDAVVLVMLVGFTALGLKVGRREYWRVAFRQVFRRRLVKVSFVVLCVYVLLAIVDSVGYHQPLRDENGNVRVHKETGRIVYSKDGLSLLDVILTPLRVVKEETYSSPLSGHRFTKKTEVTEEGRKVRVYPPLKHPRRHLLGTDKIGNDVLYLGLKGIRTGIIIGAFTTLLVVPFAIGFGVLAGYFGGWVDDVIQFVYTVLSSIPSVLLIVAFMSIFKKPGLLQLCIILGITSWTGLCRVLRGETLKLREMEYVQAAEAMGVSRFTIMLRHIAPNLMHIALITAVLSFSSRVLAEAVLTYIGIGVGPDTISWGVMINDAVGEMSRDPIIWWKLGTAFIFMLGLVLPANLFGDALRDALDPRLRTE